jgi:hypothetical protein
MSAAELRVRGRHDLFEATACRLDGAWVHAHGHWRRKVGANYQEVSRSEPRQMSWPHREIRSIRWEVPS